MTNAPSPTDMVPLPLDLCNEILVRVTVEEMTKLHAEMIAAPLADRPALLEEIQERIRFCKSLGYEITRTKVEK